MKSFRFKGRAARRVREEQGMFARQVAERVGVSTNSILRMENGGAEPSAPTYMRLCDALGVDPDELRTPIEPDQGIDEDIPEAS